MKLKLLETDPPSAVGFEIGFGDHRQQLRAAERMAHESGGLKSAWQKRGGGSFLAWRLC